MQDQWLGRWRFMLVGTPSDPSPLLSHLLGDLPLSGSWRSALLGGASVLGVDELQEVLVSLGVEQDQISTFLAKV